MVVKYLGFKLILITFNLLCNYLFISMFSVSTGSDVADFGLHRNHSIKNGQQCQGLMLAQNSHLNFHQSIMYNNKSRKILKLLIYKSIDVNHAPT